jgi:hypothetical protein
MSAAHVVQKRGQTALPRKASSPLFFINVGHFAKGQPYHFLIEVLTFLDPKILRID